MKATAHKEYSLEVHWITYDKGFPDLDGRQGWATVHANDYNRWIFYGNQEYNDAMLPYKNGFEHACFQANVTNSGIASISKNHLVVKGQEEAIHYKYKPYQWME